VNALFGISQDLSQRPRKLVTDQIWLHFSHGAQDFCRALVNKGCGSAVDLNNWNWHFFLKIMTIDYWHLLTMTAIVFPDSRSTTVVCFLRKTTGNWTDWCLSMICWLRRKGSVDLDHPPPEHATVDLDDHAPIPLYSARKVLLATSEPSWKPSVTPYVVSFWVRQSLRHAYARRVFPYAKQIEETLTRSPYAALRKWGFRLRQTCYDKARTENVKGSF